MNNPMLQKVAELTKSNKKYKQITYFVGEHEIHWDIATKKLAVTIQDRLVLEPLRLLDVELETLEVVHRMYCEENPLDDWMRVIKRSKFIVKNIAMTGYTHDGKDAVKAVISHVGDIDGCGLLEKLRLGINIPNEIDSDAYNRIKIDMKKLIDASSKNTREIVFVRNDARKISLSGEQRKNLCGDWKFKARANQIGCYNERPLFKHLFSRWKKDD